MDKNSLENILIRIYNEIAIKQVSDSKQNLFAPGTNPLDMVYFIDEVEKKLNYSFCNNDFDYEKFNNIEQIAQIIREHI